MENLGIQVKPSVAVIGAGWAGLTVAVRLADAGYRVTIFEASRVPGGRARSVDWNGSAIDNGQHLLVGAYSATLALMQHVGVDIPQTFHRMPMTVEVPGRLSLRLPRLPAPFHLLFGLIGASGATLREKISAALFMNKLKGMRYRLPIDLPVAKWLDAGHQVGTFRHQLWEPLCLAAMNTRPEEASAQTFANVLRDTLGADRQATDMLLPATDLGNTLPKMAVDYLAGKDAQIRFSTRVTAIAQTSLTPDERWQISVREEIHSFSHVVIATAPHHVADLLPDLPEMQPLRERIVRLPSEPIATVYLQYDDTTRLTTPLIALNHGMAQWLADRGQLGGADGLLAHVLSGHGPWEALDDDALAKRLHRDACEILGPEGLPEAVPVPDRRLVIRERRATFRCLPDQHRPDIRTPANGLWLVGDYIASDYPGTLESAVRSGDRLANAIISCTDSLPDSEQGA